MAVFIFANDASATLAGPISAAAVSLTLAAGAGSEFPNPGVGEQFSITLVDAATGLNNEIVYCTARLGDVCTIVRAQEGSVAQAWLPGDLASNLLTAGQMAALVQTVTLAPIREVTTSGAFTTTTADANGSVGLNRTSGVGPSSTILPTGASAAQTYSYEDLVGNFQTAPLTVSPPAGHTIAGLPSFVANRNRQSVTFQYYGGSLWSVKSN